VKIRDPIVIVGSIDPEAITNTLFPDKWQYPIRANRKITTPSLKYIFFERLRKNALFIYKA